MRTCRNDINAFQADDGSRRAVYVMTNEASGNRVILIKEAVT